MHSCSFQGEQEVLSCQHVAHRVLQEDSVEHPVESNCSHVALNVKALWVGGAADFQHPRGEVDQGQVESPLQIEGVAAAPASQLEDAIRTAVQREEARILNCRCSIVIRID